jgi:hypothetical protein
MKDSYVNSRKKEQDYFIKFLDYFSLVPGALNVSVTALIFQAQSFPISGKRLLTPQPVLTHASGATPGGRSKRLHQGRNQALVIRKRRLHTVQRVRHTRGRQNKAPRVQHPMTRKHNKKDGN